MKISKGRLAAVAGTLGTAGAVVALSLAGTSALFTSTELQNNSITAGTVEADHKPRH